MTTNPKMKTTPKRKMKGLWPKSEDDPENEHKKRKKQNMKTPPEMKKIILF